MIVFIFIASSYELRVELQSNLSTVIENDEDQILFSVMLVQSEGVPIEIPFPLSISVEITAVGFPSNVSGKHPLL